MALAFNSATKKWERTTTAPLPSSTPKAPVTARPTTGQTATSLIGRQIPKNTGNNVNESQAMFGSGLANQTPSTSMPTQNSGVPKPTVATTQNPVVDMSKPKPVPSFNQYDTSAVAGLDMNGLQDFIDQTNIDIRRGTPLTPEREAQLYKAQRRIQELNTTQQISNPIEPQISAVEEQKRREAERLATQSRGLIDKRRADLEAQYGIRANELDAQGQKTMSAAQGVLSFSGFGRSTYAADKQAEIQQNVNQAKQSMQAEKDYAIAKYEAELAGADAETLAGYDEQIAQLRQQNTNFLIQSAQAMNEYNLQTSASYEEKINNIFKLAEANNVSDLTEQEKAQASAYGDLLLDAEGNLNTALIKDIPARLVNEAIMQGAVKKASIKPKIEAPKTASDGAGNLYQFNDQTGERETIGSAGKEFKTVGDQAYAFDPTTGQTTMVAGGTTGDLRGLASQFPGQARAKNNNPAGITRNNNFATGQGTAALLDQAGIPYEIGTPRPKNEGGNYVSFPTIEDGLAAQRILMTQTYGNNTVQDMLGKWVGTGEALNYAKQVAGNAGVPLNVKVNQLNDQQIQQLQMAKIQKESPGLAKLLGQTNLSPLAQSAISSKTISGTPTSQSKVIEELQRAGEFDKGEGNANYFTTKPEKKQEIGTALQAFNTWDNFMKLYNEAKANGTLEGMTGKIDYTTGKAKAIVGMSNKTFNDMNRILQKELSTYMNRISGATVSETEVERLRQQIPNLGMGDKEFQDAVEAYNTSIRAGKGYMQDTYGLSDDYIGRLSGGSTQKVKEYNASTKYKSGDTFTKDGKTYAVGVDGNAYEQ